MDHNAMGMDPCDNQNDAIFNITTDKRTHVDARTGLFEAHVPLPSVTGNVGYGPVVDLSLYYSPVVNNHAALGDGWSFAFTTWYEKNSDLTLHTGEAMRLERGKDLITPAVMITWSDGGNTLTVERKDGRVETLKKPEAGRVWVPARLTTDGYRYLDFTWTTVAQSVGKDTHHQVRLTGIRDPDRTLLDVGYGPDETLPAKVTLTFWPGTNETLQFVLDIKDVALQSVTAPEGTKTTFGYHEHPTCGWLLTAVETFEGLKEDVEYVDNGLTFKDNPKLSALPAVNTHTVTPRAGGDKVVERYKYFWNDAPGRRDIGPDTPGGYQTEIERGGEVVAYRYHADHQMHLDYLAHGDRSRCKLIRPSENGRVYTGLSPVKATLTSYDGQKVAAGSPFTYSLVLEQGLVAQLDNGSITSFVYMSDDGQISPAHAFQNGYVLAERSGHASGRLNELIVDNFHDQAMYGHSPFPTDVGALSRSLAETRPTITKDYGYQAIPGINRHKLGFLVQTIFNGLEVEAQIGQNVEYYNNADFRKGRQKTIKQGGCTVPPDIYQPAFFSKMNIAESDRPKVSPNIEDSTSTSLSFDYALDETHMALTTITTEIRTNASRTSKETRSILSGRLFRQTDVDGNDTIYAYDAHGRLSTQTICAQSDTYQQVTTYTYPSIGRVEVIGADGTARAIESDGRDNTVREQTKDTPTGIWRDMLAVEYDGLGRKKKSTRYDYLADGMQIAESCEFGYDNWGNECRQSFSDGRTLFNIYDPAKRVREEWTNTADDKQRKRTTYRENDTIEKVEWLDAEGNINQTQSLMYTDAGKISEIFTSGLSSDRSVTFDYDAIGRMISETHEGGPARKQYSLSYIYTYPHDWLIEDAAKIEIEIRKKTITLGERTFDSWGRVTSLTRAGITETYSYTGARTVPDTKTGADGKTLSYEYIKELGNRVSKVTGENQSQTKAFAYTHLSDRTSTASEGDVLLAFDHDLNERVTKARTQVSKGTETTVKRTWSPAGRLLGETDAMGEAITYEYDVKGRRVRTVAGNLTTTHDYDSQNRPAAETVTLASDAVEVSYVYDAFGREEQRRFQLANGFDLIIERRYYPDGRLQSTELKDGGVSKGKRRYGYTPLGQLETCETTGAWRPKNPKGKLIDKQFFFYDDLDNVIRSETRFDGERCRSLYSYDEATASRLEEVAHDHADYKPSAALAYDANGRVTRDASGKTYSYDWLGRLTQAGSRHYSYDAMDRIATTGTGDENRQVVYDGMQVRGEYNANGSGRQLDPGSAACTVQRVKRSGVERTLFELRDLDGTVLLTYDATSKTMKHHAYSAYGAHTSEETDSLLGFNGEYRDTENDQYPLGQGYRSYDPTSMRFHAPDDWSPFGRGGHNAYGYGKGDPVNWQDPSGHMAVGSGAVNRGLRARWGSSLPGPLGLGSKGALISTIIWSGLGVLTAIATGGASLLLTAALVGMSIVAAATAITAVIVSDTNPELAAILGWVSLGFTIAGGVASLAKKLGEFVMKIGRSGMAVARHAYHRIAVAASRLKANGIRSTFRSRTSTYRPSSSEGFGSLEQIDEVRPPARPAGARVFSSIEEGYPVPFDFELPPPEQRSAFLGLLDKVHDSLNVGDINTVVCTVTGVLGNAGYFDSEQDAFINGNINNSTWLPWGSFNLGRYGFR